jgi:hypothetical protein
MTQVATPENDAILEKLFSHEYANKAIKFVQDKILEMNKDATDGRGKSLNVTEDFKNLKNNRKDKNAK